MALNIDQINASLNGLRVLIAGDVMMDAYLWGSVNRISPEAPVPVMLVNRKENRLGGAANVALNVRALGGIPIMASVVGDDDNSRILLHLMREAGMDTTAVVTSAERPTTVKTRVISQRQHVVRIDEETDAPLSKSEEEVFLARMDALFTNQPPHVVIFEDYNKGVLTPAAIAHLTNLAHKHAIPVCVDPKKENFFAYKGVTLFKPNLKELREGLKMDLPSVNTTSLLEAHRQLHARLNHHISLITLSEQGVFIANQKEHHLIAAHRREITDVSGAGDTVISVAAMALALGLDLPQVAAMANLAGGLVCEHVGVVPVNKERLLKEAQLLNI